MNLWKLYNSQWALSKLLDLEMWIEKAFELATFIKEAESELVAFNKVREKVIKENTKDWKPDVEKITPELEKLLDKEVKIKLPTLDIKDFAGKIDTRSILTLDYLLTK